MEKWENAGEKFERSPEGGHSGDRGMEVKVQKVP